jgi:cyanate lyase
MTLSSPEDRKKLLNAVIELSNSMTRVDAERDFQKDAVNAITEELDLQKKYVRKVARIYHKQNITDVKIENEEVEELYELMSSNIGTNQ